MMIGNNALTPSESALMSAYLNMYVWPHTASTQSVSQVNYHWSCSNCTVPAEVCLGLDYRKSFTICPHFMWTPATS